jgi:sterol desaturase/sphingolipid hydroxylase (fatty acid hydroxylase superfamily)
VLETFAYRVQDATFLFAVCLLLAFATAESLCATRRIAGPPLWRWVANISLFVGAASVMGFLMPHDVVAVLVGDDGNEANRPLALLAAICGEWPVLVAGFLVMDLFLYTAHVVEHRVFVLWRMHVVHHSDTECDISTAVRHHPIEPVAHWFVGSAIYVLLGLPVWVIALYGFFTTAFGYAQHANVRLLSPRLDRALQAVFMTPDMHRVHHSIMRAEHDANYGNLLSIWDHLFGTYRAMGVVEFEAVQFGVQGLLASRDARPDRVFLLPLTLCRERSVAGRGNGPLVFGWLWR